MNRTFVLYLSHQDHAPTGTISTCPELTVVNGQSLMDTFLPQGVAMARTKRRNPPVMLARYHTRRHEGQAENLALTIAEVLMENGLPVLLASSQPIPLFIKADLVRISQLTRRYGYQLIIADGWSTNPDPVMNMKGDHKLYSSGRALMKDLRGISGMDAYPIIPLDQLTQFVMNPPSRIPDNINRVVFIGDIHDHANALNALITKIDPTPDTLFIFTGDLFTGGPDPQGVLEAVTKLEHAWFVLGNHDWAYQVQLSSLHPIDPPLDKDPERVIPRTLALIASMHPYLDLDLFGQQVFVSHAGTAPSVIEDIRTNPKARYPIQTFMLGPDTPHAMETGYPSWICADPWINRHDNPPFQIHGHINSSLNPHPYPWLTNLEAGVKHGGAIRAAVYHRDDPTHAIIIDQPTV